MTLLLIDAATKDPVWIFFVGKKNFFNLSFYAVLNASFVCGYFFLALHLNRKISDRMVESSSQKSDTILQNEHGKLPGAGATFDWTLFDNSNRRKVVRRPSKVVMFDLDLVQRGSSNCRTIN